MSLKITISYCKVGLNMGIVGLECDEFVALVVGVFWCPLQSWLCGPAGGGELFL